MFRIDVDAERAFGIRLIRSSDMDQALDLWDNVSAGTPPWASTDKGIGTINMAKHISDTRARLITLDLGISVSGGERAQYLQTVADDLLRRLPERVADAARLGGVMIKYNGKTWDYILPGSFGVTAVDGNGDIVGAVFAQYLDTGDAHYTRLEYHRYEGNVYVVSNKAFMASAYEGGNRSLGREIPLDRVPEWADMAPEARIGGVKKPLFGYFRIPGSNVEDPTSPLGVSVFANALAELEAIDVAVSRKNAEVMDSQHITFVGQAITQSANNKGLSLPRFVMGLGMGIDDAGTSSIREHVPTMLTDQRIRDINFDLSMAGIKCGFSEGVFVMNGQTGVITATQVEANDRDTIQTIKADRDALQTAVEQAMEGANVLASLYDVAPLGEYEMTFNFGDITYSYEEDKANYKSYALQGWIPVWKYLVQFEKMSEEEAKALQAEVMRGQMDQMMAMQQAQQPQPTEPENGAEEEQDLDV